MACTVSRGESVCGSAGTLAGFARGAGCGFAHGDSECGKLAHEQGQSVEVERHGAFARTERCSGEQPCGCETVACFGGDLEASVSVTAARIRTKRPARETASGSFRFGRSAANPVHRSFARTFCRTGRKAPCGLAAMPRGVRAT